MQCTGRVALVTGSSNAIGRSIALTLAREGARVVVNCRTSTADADALVNHIVSAGGEAVAALGDVYTKEGCEAVFEAARKAFKKVDICIISPGAGWSPEGRISKLDAEAAIAEVEREVAPVYRLMKLVLPGMYKRKWGRIIGISLALNPGSPSFAYDVAKAARTQLLLKASRGESWANGVTVNIIAPGPVAACKTLEEAAAQCEHADAWLSRSTTSGQDIAEGIAFLCSEAARFVTGCELTYSWRQ
ncbi:MAG: SDR family NAD(P)-dependent oxidoreductase [Chitinivibrionales bacterium]|nr:SDR family NAD(P)-dependent oxidoreductase [Chitinivibrionales bacterium]